MTELKLIRMIEAADLDDIAVGGAILGTGGGGDPYIGKLMAQGAIRKHGPVRLVHRFRESTHIIQARQVSISTCERPVVD